MKRHLLTLVLSGLVGSFVLAGNAEACHKKRCTCAPAPACVVAAPSPSPSRRRLSRPVALPGRTTLCSPASRESSWAATRKPLAAPVATCETIAYSAPISYSAPVYSSPQVSAQH